MNEFNLTQDVVASIHNVLPSVVRLIRRTSVTRYSTRYSLLNPKPRLIRINFVKNIILRQISCFFLEIKATYINTWICFSFQWIFNHLQHKPTSKHLLYGCLAALVESNLWLLSECITITHFWRISKSCASIHVRLPDAGRLHYREQEYLI